MKLKMLFLMSILIVPLLAACGQGQKKDEKDDAVMVSVVLTQTAAAIPTSTPVPAKGTISGKVGIMAPPSPAMVVYAVDPATGKWGSAEAPANPSVGEFSIDVPPGSYQLFAFVKDSPGPASAAYVDEKGLKMVTVAANQKVSDIGVYFPGQAECGISMALPGSPDGKYVAYPGPDAACLANAKAAEQAAAAAQPPVASSPVRVQFAPGSSSWSISTNLQAGGSSAYILGAAKGQIMTVTVSTTPANSGTLYIRTADGIILQQRAYPEWTMQLPASQDYVVGVDNPTQQTIQYFLTISIPPGGNAGLPAKSGPVNQTIRYDAGPLSLTINGAVINGQRDRYNLSLMKGEMLDVIITSTEANAVFSIIGPDGNALPGTEEGKDTNNWAVPAPSDGTYSIVVGSTRGNATYSLVVNVK
jgi:hypothetical protein